jgi:hypothetical protein
MTNLSVTRVLEMSGLIPPYPPDARFFVERAGDLGEAVHEWAQYIDTTEDPDVDGLEGCDLVPYIMAYQKFREKYQPEWLSIEQPAIREGIGGCADRIGYLCNGDQNYTILEIKTSQRIANWWGLQLTGYQWIYEEYEARLQVLHLGRNASYRLLEYPSEPGVWDAAMQISHWKIQNP